MPITTTAATLPSNHPAWNMLSISQPRSQTPVPDHSLDPTLPLASPRVPTCYTPTCYSSTSFHLQPPSASTSLPPIETLTHPYAFPFTSSANTTLPQTTTTCITQTPINNPRFPNIMPPLDNNNPLPAPLPQASTYSISLPTASTTHGGSPMYSYVTNTPSLSPQQRPLTDNPSINGMQTSGFEGHTGLGNGSVLSGGGIVEGGYASVMHPGIAPGSTGDEDAIGVGVGDTNSDGEIAGSREMRGGGRGSGGYGGVAVGRVKKNTNGSDGESGSTTEGKKKRRYKCSRCTRDFAQKGSRVRHERTVHDQVRRYVCKECKFPFQQSYDLKAHVNGVHLKIKDFKCEYPNCQSMFSRKAKLTLHVRTVHKNIRRFKCKRCIAAFAERSNLGKHVRSVHDNIRKYKCNRCGTKFKEKGHLNKHMNAVHLSGKYGTPPPMMNGQEDRGRENEKEKDVEEGSITEKEGDEQDSNSSVEDSASEENDSDQTENSAQDKV